MRSVEEMVTSICPILNQMPNGQKHFSKDWNLEQICRAQNPMLCSQLPQIFHSWLVIKDDKKIAGLGIGGKIGWGKDIHHIAVTGQGLNFRSFIDVKIKSSFYASGGFEYIIKNRLMNCSKYMI